MHSATRRKSFMIKHPSEESASVLWHLTSDSEWMGYTLINRKIGRAYAGLVKYAIRCTYSPSIALHVRQTAVRPHPSPAVLARRRERPQPDFARPAPRRRAGFDARPAQAGRGCPHGDGNPLSTSGGTGGGPGQGRRLLRRPGG